MNIEDTAKLAAIGGVITSFLLAAYTAWRTERTRRVSNYLSLVSAHRDIWKLIFQYNEPSDALLMSEQNWTRKISEKEEMFVSFIVLNLHTNFEFMKSNSIITQDGLARDIKTFFSLPIPRRIWEETKLYHRNDFVEFVDERLTAQPKVKILEQ